MKKKEKLETGGTNCCENNTEVAGKYEEATFFLLCNFLSPRMAAFNKNLRQSCGATEPGNLVCRISALDSLDLGRLRLRPNR